MNASPWPKLLQSLKRLLNEPVAPSVRPTQYRVPPPSAFTVEQGLL
jgi:hypothetical protein